MLKNTQEAEEKPFGYGMVCTEEFFILARLGMRMTREDVAIVVLCYGIGNDIKRNEKVRIIEVFLGSN